MNVRRAVAAQKADLRARDAASLRETELPCLTQPHSSFQPDFPQKLLTARIHGRRPAACQGRR